MTKKKLVLISIGIILILSAGVVLAKTSALDRFIPQLSSWKKTQSVKKDDDVNHLLEEDELSEEGEAPTQDEILHGETYLDDVKATIKADSFDPKTITIKAGTTIVWTNQDTKKHQIVVDGGAQTIPILPKKSGSIIFNKRGTYTYHDGLHTEMSGSVIVQ